MPTLQKHPLAVARDNWFISEEGKTVSEPTDKPLESQFLLNRLEMAFCAGWNACAGTMVQTASKAASKAVKASLKALLLVVIAAALIGCKVEPQAEDPTPPQPEPQYFYVRVYGPDGRQIDYWTKTTFPTMVVPGMLTFSNASYNPPRFVMVMGISTFSIEANQ